MGKRNRVPHPEDREGVPGLHAQDVGPLPPQIVDFLVASCGMNSKTEGLIPGVILTIQTDDGDTHRFVMRADKSAAVQAAADFSEVIQRARLDVAAYQSSRTPGTGKSHG